MAMYRSEPTRSTVLSRLYRRHRVFRWLSKLLPIGALLLLWEFASGTVVPAGILPPFSTTSSEIVLFATDPRFQEYLGLTLFRGFAGILVAICLAVPLGLGMARNDFLRRNLDPVVSITYPVPKSPLIPLVIFWLGMGNASRITLAVIGSFLPVLISAYNGADGVPRHLLWSARSMGLSNVQEVYKVVFPAALPTIMTGVRIGVIFSFIIIVSSEMILAHTGLGVLIVEFGQFGQYAKVFAVVFWIAVVVSGIDRLYLLLSARLLRWSDQDVGGI